MLCGVKGLVRRVWNAAITTKAAPHESQRGQQMRAKCQTCPSFLVENDPESSAHRCGPRPSPGRVPVSVSEYVNTLLHLGDFLRGVKWALTCTCNNKALNVNKLTTWLWQILQGGGTGRRPCLEWRGVGGEMGNTTAAWTGTDGSGGAVSWGGEEKICRQMEALAQSSPFD